MTSLKFPHYKLLIHCFYLLIAIVISGCGLMEIKEQAKVIEDAGILKGKVIVKSNKKGPVVVTRLRDDNGVLIVENYMVATQKGEYQFDVLPGVYTIFAFIDSNRDGEFQRGKEHGNYHKGPLTIKVREKQTVRFKTLVIKGDPPLRPDNAIVKINKTKITKNIGKVTSFNNPIFTRDNYSMGYWRPVDFLNKVGGGLMMLQKYDKRKTPVLFVHGINGGPDDFKSMIKSLDKRRFQPWILYYPSGLRLDMVSEYLVKAVQELKHRHGFEEFIVIAHSMGGIVTRSYIKKYSERFPSHARKIKLVMTINSPMAGMPSAASGVSNSPIVVPSWRDVAANSDFVKGIHTWRWPSYIPYHLVFSYKDGDDGDGVVAIKSQIPYKLQTESVHMYGFKNDHVGTLRDKEFLKLFNSILKNSIK